MRIGVAGVKVTAVGEGITAADLGLAIQNSLGEYFKGTRVEIVPLEAELPSALSDKAKEKQCEINIVVTVASHKKGGGGGFGFGKMLAQTIGQTGIGHTGSVAGNIAGQMATSAIVSAGANFRLMLRQKTKLRSISVSKSPADNGHRSLQAI